MPRNVTGPFASTGREVYIAEAVRTPVGKSHPERGWYRDIHPNAMLAACYTELIRRTEIPPALVEDLVVGCTAPFGEQSRNIARNAWLQAGYPPEVPATTLDRRCGSAQTAVEMAAALVASGTHDVVIAGGVEHMSHVPIDSPIKISELYGDPWPPSCATATPLCTKVKAPSSSPTVGSWAVMRWMPSPRGRTRTPPRPSPTAASSVRWFR